LRDRRLLGFGNWTQVEFLAGASLLERDFSGGLGVSHPLSSSPWSDQITLAVHFHEIDWSGVEVAGFSAADFEQVVVGEAQAETNEKSENAVEDSFAGAWFAENGESGVHALIIVRSAAGSTLERAGKKSLAKAEL